VRLTPLVAAELLEGTSPGVPIGPLRARQLWALLAIERSDKAGERRSDETQQHAVTLLAVETSCDETSAAVVSDGARFRTSFLPNQAHAEHGGVVPELATREYL
jgi:hypothetical protein